MLLRVGMRSGMRQVEGAGRGAPCVIAPAAKKQAGEYYASVQLRATRLSHP